MTFGSGVLDPYHVSADTSKNFLNAGYCKVIPSNVASIKKNWHDTSHCVIVASDDYILDNSGYLHTEWFLGQFGNRPDKCAHWSRKSNHTWSILINPEWNCSHCTGSGMLHNCFRLAMGTLPQVRENDNVIPFQKRSNRLNRLFTWELSIEFIVSSDSGYTSSDMLISIILKQILFEFFLKLLF